MANPYIQLRDETMASGLYKLVPVLWTDFSDGTISQQSVERSANGTLLVSIGKTIRTWRGVFKIGVGERSAMVNGVKRYYATRADIETWCTSDNPLKRKITMIDNYALPNVTHNVFILSPADFRYGSAVPDGINSFFLVPFEMQTRAAVTV